MQKMENETQLVQVFTGSEISVVLLKGELDAIGIPAIIQNDFQSGVFAGFSGGFPSSIDLFIRESDLKQAEPIINQFIQDNKE